MVPDAVQTGEPVECGEPVGGDGAGKAIAQVGGQGPVDVAGDDDAALYIVLFLGPLLRHLLDAPVVDVARQHTDNLAVRLCDEKDAMISGKALA